MMRASFIALCLLAPAIAFAQADSGRPGTLFFVEGDVFLKDAPVTINPALPKAEVRNEQRLRTEQGNAEMLFALGSFIRLGSNSEIEMVDAGLSSATVRLHRGKMIVEAFRTWGGESLKVLVGDDEIARFDPGEMRIAAEPGSIEVLDGSVVVKSSGQEYKVKKKQSVALGFPGAQTTKIKGFTEDDLTAWHEQRVETVLAETPKSKRRNRSSDVDSDGERPFGLGDLPDRSQAGIGN